MVNRPEAAINLMQAAQVREFFRSREDTIVSSIREIVEIESPSRAVDQIGRVAEWIEERAGEIGLSLAIEKTRAEGFGVHLIIRAFAGAGEPILLLGHIDTVHPLGSKERNPTRIEGDRFYGCGIFDMKANVVIMLEALRYFADTGASPPHSLTILLTCDEEVGSHTGRALVEREARLAARCFVFEPSADGSVKTGRKGTGTFTVSVGGIPAHAGLDPEKGASAIYELAQQVLRLHSLEDASAGTTVNVCTFAGGTATNVIPEHAECTVDVRFATMAEADRVVNAIAQLQPIDPRVSLKISGGVNRPPMERTTAVANLYNTARRIADSFDYELGEAQVGGASDGNFVAALGVPVLDGLGITGKGAHTLSEHISVSDISNRAALVTLLLMED